jgi:glycosyltransferase involved in cell wall biosynthesis
VDLHFGFHPRKEIARWVGGALACAYIPYDEDSLGYVTMEAVASAKAVLTTTDSGGLLELVNEHTGKVTAPTSEALAEGLAALWENPKRTRALGVSAQEAWRRRAISWDATIERLLM